MDNSRKEIIYVKLTGIMNTLNAVIIEFKKEVKPDRSTRCMIAMFETVLRVICNIRDILQESILPSKMAKIVYLLLHDIYGAMNIGFSDNIAKDPQWPESEFADLQEITELFYRKLEQTEMVKANLVAIPIDD